MINYLDFKKARCKDCYKCLRECPVKAIEFVDHQAKIIEDRCILCGKCTSVCPQNAKHVHSETEEVKQLFVGSEKVVASVAPSFVSSFGVFDFEVFKDALKKIGFYDAEETSVGAKAITEEYRKMLKSGKYKNLITSACPAVNRLIQLYYHDALAYLAPCDTPMLAHAKIIKKKYPDCKIVFIGPCIAKKREAKESGLIDGVLTYEDLQALFEEKGIDLKNTSALSEEKPIHNMAKFYPISRGIIKSFGGYVEGYEFVAVDGTEKCKEVLENINNLSGMFLELNSCEYACVNGPCSLIKSGTAVTANADIRAYAVKSGSDEEIVIPEDLDFSFTYEKLYEHSVNPTEVRIKEILSKTGKNTPEDELNCGACGYNTCREKAWAVANGFAELEMCVPFMRERAESMSYEIIQNSPNGIVLLDFDYNIVEINSKAMALYGITDTFVKNRPLFDYVDASDYIIALSENKNLYRKRIFIEKTSSYAELTVVILKNQNVLFGVLKDVTQQTEYDRKLDEVKRETLATTAEVINKQMRVAQEIASLLGETTAETKVALLKLKKTYEDDKEKGE